MIISWRSSVGRRPLRLMQLHSAPWHSSINCVFMQQHRRDVQINILALAFLISFIPSVQSLFPLLLAISPAIELRRVRRSKNGLPHCSSKRSQWPHCYVRDILFILHISSGTTILRSQIEEFAIPSRRLAKYSLIGTSLSVKISKYLVVGLPLSFSCT